MELFHGTQVMGISPEDIGGVELGSMGVPEFGTDFVMQMLKDTNPQCFSDLVRISGLSHGTDVWLGNAQTLIEEGQAEISTAICCRDDIMTYLINMGLDKELSFTIMEKVRKGKGLTSEWEEEMTSHGVPDWYIWSCETLKYMFPRAPAAAYVMMSIRMAWFKVNYPEAFYAAWFTSKVDSFDAESISKGIPEIERQMDEIDKLGNTATAKQKEHMTVYEVMYEMMSRGYEFAEPQLGVSEACRFSVVNGRVTLPFNAINGIGDTAAQSLVEAYKNKPFSTIDDVRSRTKLSASNIDDLKRHGLFGGLPESAQVSIFDMMA
jgi:DNA polymerase-3 subunit alpha (Gram-positive type)